MRRWVVGRSPDRIFYSQALDGSYLATPDGQMAGSPLSLWITGALQIPHRLQKVGNRCWRSLSVENLLQRGLREPVGAQPISFPPRSPRLQSPSLVGKSAVRIGAAMRLAEPAIRDRGLKGASMASAQIHARPGTSQPATKVRVNVARLPSALPSGDRPRV
jgi:hypothetical protein